jgi:hypothetical protein
MATIVEPPPGDEAASTRYRNDPSRASTVTISSGGNCAGSLGGDGVLAVRQDNGAELRAVDVAALAVLGSSSTTRMRCSPVMEIAKRNLRRGVDRLAGRT